MAVRATTTLTTNPKLSFFYHKPTSIHGKPVCHTRLTLTRSSTKQTTISMSLTPPPYDFQSLKFQPIKEVTASWSSQVQKYDELKSNMITKSDE
ncbi:unnamed protein product [Sphenostylis stenocarpa]|uniref:Uncharacterized protein n=1 Tax=Sphenostylis stenocarpa TaxID=92480 RepID=A0AA86W2H1_9FABA|nr:unnamed protein product [Sphenostylis stenocarpa]